MPRRRRRRARRKRSSRWLVAVQLVGLAGILVFILLFRNFIADGASQVFGAFGDDDIEVSQEVDEGASTDEESDTPETDEGAPVDEETKATD